MIAHKQPDNSVNDRLLAIARLATLVWFLMSFIFILIAIWGKWQTRHTLLPGNASGFAFYGWTKPQLQTLMARLEIQPEIVTETMLASSMVCLVFFLGIGGLLFWRRADTWMGLLGAFVLWGIGPGFSNLLLTEAQIPSWATNLYSLSALFIWPTFFVILYLFPTGKFVPRFTRFLAVIPYILFGVPLFFPDNPKMESISVFILISYAVGGLASQIYRYWKTSTPTERQQTKWVVFAFGVFIGVLVAQSTLLMPLAGAIGTPTRFWYEFLGNGVILPQILIPLALGISILRYRLFDIDVIIRKTVQYSLVTAVLGLVYYGSVLLLQGVFTRVTGEKSAVALVLSTLLIAALFTPSRRRIQGFIDGRFFRKKYNAQQVLDDFAQTARDEVDMEALTAELIRIIQETMQPQEVSMWLKPGEGQRHRR